MKTNVVYVSASGPNDLYFEETALSAYSLKLHQPDAYIILVVDQGTKDAIVGPRAKLLAYFNEVKVVQVPETYTQHQRSRYLKTILREELNGDFLYIDSDTIVCAPLEEIDNCTYSIAAAIDKHLPLASHPRKELTDFNLKKYFNYKRTLKDVNFFNSGVLFVRDNQEAYDLYREWHRLWKYALSQGLGIDQPALLIANHNCDYPIQELDGTWNCQVMDNGLRFLADAKILHYFASNSSSSYFLLKDEGIFKEMKQSGEICEKTQSLVANAKASFTTKVVLSAASEAEFLRSHVYTCFRYHPTLFKILNGALGAMFRLF